MDANLQEALKDLEEVVEEARESDYPTPSKLALGIAEKILREMYNYLPMRYEVYPMPKGEVAIQAFNGKQQSLLVDIFPEGSVICFSNLGDERKQLKCEMASNGVRDFVFGELSKIKN